MSGWERITITSYDNFSTRYLSSLYFFIKVNIENGELSKAMHQELKLIREAARKKGVIILQNKDTLANHNRYLRKRYKGR
ncbi:hypothetical protein EWH99_10060 [Sporolactobacillus sp. THM7-7]|nr:hypothetical protein EWH99_10060 [Sporolactobacillus sp. THM7-7]